MYHIKIEDLETGKVEVDTTSGCIIASINLPDEHKVHNIACLDASAATIMKVSENLMGLNRRVMTTLLDDMLKEVTTNE